MSKYNPEIEAYTNLLMKCVNDDDFFDEGLVNYLLNYKREIIEGYYFKKKESHGVVKSNLWGYIKSNTYIKKQEKWAKLLNKDINSPIKYEYLKFNFEEREKRDRKVEYKPLYFREYGKNDQYLEVGEEFLKIVRNNYKNEKDNEEQINVESLNEIEIKLIINDCLNDTNIDKYNRLRNIPGYNDLLVRIKNHIIDNYEDMEQLANESKKSLLRLIAMGNSTINEAFQSITSREREQFIEKHNLEEKLLTYMRYKDINKNYLINSIQDYKDKNFWMRTLKCFSEDKSVLSIFNMLQDVIKVSSPVEDMYKTGNIPSFIKLENYNYYTNVDEYAGVENYERITKLLNFFKEDIKNASNYKEEMEKLMILAIGSESEQLYKISKVFMTKEDGYQEDMDFQSVLYKKVIEAKSEFVRKMKKQEVKEFNEKLENKLLAKGIKEKTLKI